MSPELQEKIAKRCPILFKPNSHVNEEYYYGPYIECDDGWFQIILDASIEIEKIVSGKTLDEQEDTEVIQIKEKFGTLRYYMNHYDDKISKIIAEAENKSAVTCEKCGNPGAIGRIGRWYSTRCGKACGGDKWEPYDNEG
jgi:hypothetical protein